MTQIQRILNINPAAFSALPSQQSVCLNRFDPQSCFVSFSYRSITSDIRFQILTFIPRTDYAPTFLNLGVTVYIPNKMANSWTPHDLRKVTDPQQLQEAIKLAELAFETAHANNTQVLYENPGVSVNDHYLLSTPPLFSYADIARTVYSSDPKNGMRVSAGAPSTALASAFPKGVYATEIAPYAIGSMSKRSSRLGFFGAEYGTAAISAPDRVIRGLIDVDYWIALKRTTGFRERGELLIGGTDIKLKHFSLPTPGLEPGEYLAGFEIIAWGVSLLPEHLEGMDGPNSEGNEKSIKDQATRSSSV